jgi:hypothetical protein
VCSSDLTVFTTQQLVGLSPLFEGSEVLMFPNPVESLLHLNWECLAPKQIEIHGMMGNLQFREIMTPAQTIDLSNWQQGIYFVRIDGKTYPVVKH